MPNTYFSVVASLPLPSRLVLLMFYQEKESLKWTRAKKEAPIQTGASRFRMWGRVKHTCISAELIYSVRVCPRLDKLLNMLDIV